MSHVKLNDVQPSNKFKFLGIDLSNWGEDKLFMYMIKHKISGINDSIIYIENFLIKPESLGYRKKYYKNIITLGLDNKITENNSVIWNSLINNIDYEKKLEVSYEKKNMIKAYLNFKTVYPNKSCKNFNDYIIKNYESVSVEKKYITAIGLIKLYKIISKEQVSKIIKSELNKLLIFAIDRTEYYEN
jgi:hypothetical protein